MPRPSCVGVAVLRERLFTGTSHLILAYLALGLFPSGFWERTEIAEQHRFVHESFPKPSGRINYFFLCIPKAISI